MFDVNLDEVEVTLSFMRWLDGKGLVKDAKVKGVRGVIGEHASTYLVWILAATDRCRSPISFLGQVQPPRTRRFPSQDSTRRF